MARCRHDGKDEGVDAEQQQRVDERPEEAEDRSPVARFQFARHEALDERAMAKELPEAMQQSGMGRP